MQRTDIHRPAEINPEDYNFVGYQYLKINDIGDAAFLGDERRRIQRHMERTGGKFSTHEHGGNCHICGAHCIYTAVFYHKPTNVYIKTGLECADKLDRAVDGTEFRKQVRAALEAVAGKRKAKAVLEQNGLGGTYLVYDALTTLFRDGKALGQLWLDLGGNAVHHYDGKPNTRNPLWEEYTITDIVGKLVKYGNISDAQIGFLQKLVARIEGRPALWAERKAQQEAKEAKHANAQVVPEGRTTVRGVVLSVKYDQGPFQQTKILVEDDRGFKVYGTKPAAFYGEVKGRRVEFDAKLERSDRDDKFGFFSRPTKARELEVGEVK